jgi:peroxiredoxin
MSLIDELDALRARMPSEARDQIARDTDQLTRSEVLDRSLNAGDQAPNFTLPDTDGQPVQLSDLLTRGPVVLSFYRGHWCPFCTLELQSLEGAFPAIGELGATLVAVSPEAREYTRSTRDQNDLCFHLLTDRGNRLAHQFGIVYRVQDDLLEAFAELDIELSRYNDDESFELPVPATYVIGPDRTIHTAFVDPDYTRRLDPIEIISTLRRLKHTA